jgi:5-methylcytosine-specific restriction endonuclease McrA
MAQWSKKIYLSLKLLVYKLDNGVCHICKKPVDYHDATLDHIIPITTIPKQITSSSDEYWNLRLAHKKCNTIRGAAKVAGQLRLNIPIKYSPKEVDA